jgi:preprotein translocase SecE subunit
MLGVRVPPRLPPLFCVGQETLKLRNRRIMSKDDQTWLNMCYMVFALIIAYVGHKAVFTLGVQLGWTERFDTWFPTANNLLALIVGGTTAFWIRSDEERREYHLGAIGELRKVKWPSVPDTKKMTWVVCVVVAIFAVILAFFDIIWSKALQFVLP